MNEEYQDQIEGRNAVIELLESGRDVNKILIAKGEKHGSINKIIAMAKENKIIVTEIERNKLNQISQTQNNQGPLFCGHPAADAAALAADRLLWRHHAHADHGLYHQSGRGRQHERRRAANGGKSAGCGIRPDEL